MEAKVDEIVHQIYPELSQDEQTGKKITILTNLANMSLPDFKSFVIESAESVLSPKEFSNFREICQKLENHEV